MNSPRHFLFLVFAAALQGHLHSQTIRWESMDGPTVTESRIHLRFPDGDRLVIGNRTGTYRTTDNGLTWVHLSSVPGPNFSVTCSSTGVLLGKCDTPVVSYDKHEPVTQVVYRSTDRGAHWVKVFADRYVGGTAFTGDTIYQLTRYSGGWPGFSGSMTLVTSTDRGVHWKCILNASEVSHWPFGISAVYTQPGNVFVRWAELAGPEISGVRPTGGRTGRRCPAIMCCSIPPATFSGRGPSMSLRDRHQLKTRSSIVGQWGDLADDAHGCIGSGR